MEAWLDALSPAVSLAALASGVILLVDRIPVPVEGRFGLGVAFVGLSLIAAFLDLVLTGRVPLLHRVSAQFAGRHDRLGRLPGVLMVVVGASLVIGGVAEWQSPGFFDRVLMGTAPGQGLLLLLGGMLSLLVGTILIWGYYKGSITLQASLRGLPQGVAGLLLSLLGVGLLGLGLLRILAPQTLDRWIIQWLSAVGLN